MSEHYDVDSGFHFDPTENQLIKDYLSPKINEGKEFDFILDMDVYAMEPWLLEHNMNPFFKKYEWYYFVTRTQVSESENNIGRGKKAKRKIIGDNGTWKANAKEKILDEETGKTIGEKQTLTFIKSNNNKQKREDGTSATVPGSDSSWTMTEYMLVEEYKFQGRVLCKIHEIKKSKDDHHEASASTSTSTSSSTYYHHHVSSSSEQLPINEHEYAHAPCLEQPINEHEYTRAPCLEQPINDLEHARASSSEQQPTNINCNIQEDERYDNENPIPHHHEFGPASSSDAKDRLEDYPIDAISVDAKDQQQAPISAPSDVNVSSAPLGDRFQPIQLDEEGEDWIREVYALTREEEDAPNLQWMDQDRVPLFSTNSF